MTATELQEENRRLRISIAVLEDLCSGILACLEVNMLRGSMTTEDDAHFDRMRQEWRERLMQSRTL